MKHEYYTHKRSGKLYKRVIGMVFVRKEDRYNNNKKTRFHWTRIGEFKNHSHLLEPVENVEEVFFLEDL